jgi:hypothetical protein
MSGQQDEWEGPDHSDQPDSLDSTLEFDRLNGGEAVKFETRDEADAWRRELARIIPALISGETTVTEHEWVPPPEKPAVQP